MAAKARSGQNSGDAAAFDAAMAEAGRLMNEGRFEAAAAAYDRAGRANRRHPVPRFHRGRACLAAGQLELAESGFRDAIRLDDSISDFHFELGRTRRMLGRLDLALTSLDRALELLPGEADYVAERARVLRLAGNKSEAWETLKPLVDAGTEHAGVLFEFGHAAPGADRTDEAVTRLRELVENESQPEDARAACGFILGRLLDRINRHDEAWQVFVTANGLKGSAFDADAHDAAIDDLMRVWNADRLASLPRVTSALGRSASLPIFVVGMPRSGTSLVEKIIAAHPQAAGAGELMWMTEISMDLLSGSAPYAELLDGLKQHQLDRAANGYVKRLKKVARKADRVVDKMPQNLLHLGLISILFPEARVVHCRRDALDTCLSCYFQELTDAIDFNTDLTDLGRYYRSYERLMSHWSSVLEVPTLDVVYEDLVSDLDGQVHRLLDFLDLPFDDASLRYHESDHHIATASYDQVRQPIYASSVGRWKAYESHLDPLRTALGLPPA